jgi:hypothetical protein
MSLNLDKSTWKRVAFGDVIDSITDRVDNPSEAGVDRYVGLEHLDPGVMTVQRWDSPDKVEAQKLRFQPGDVIFGRRRAYQKKVAKAEFEGICSAHALVLRGRPDYIDPDFLPVFLSSDYFLERAIEISVGSLSPTVNWRDLKVQEFEFPPFDEQKRIADLLWAVERHRVETVKSLVIQGAVLREGLSALLFREAVGESRSIGELATVKHGFAFPGSGFSDDLNYPTVMTPGNFAIGGGFQEAAPKTLLGEYGEDFALSPGDVVVTMTDLSKAGDTLGYSAVVPDGRTYLHNQRIGKVMVKSDAMVLPEFLAWVLRTNDYREYILRTAAGSTVRHTSPARIEQYRIRIPKELAQRSALAKVERLCDAQSSTRDALAALLVFRTSIFTEVFGGN